MHGNQQHSGENKVIELGSMQYFTFIIFGGASQNHSVSFS